MAQIQVRDTLDTNLIVHYVLNDIPAQYRKVRRLLGSGDRHYVPDLAMTEAVYALETHYSQSRAEAAFLLQSFLERYDAVLDYNRDLFALAFPFWVAHPALSFNDCCMGFYAELNHAEPLFTFDQSLARQHNSAKKL